MNQQHLEEFHDLGSEACTIALNEAQVTPPRRGDIVGWEGQEISGVLMEYDGGDAVIKIPSEPSSDPDAPGEVVRVPSSRVYDVRRASYLIQNTCLDQVAIERARRARLEQNA